MSELLFTAMKVVAELIMPLPVVCALLLLGVLLGLRRPWLGRALLLVGLVLLVGASTPRVSQLLLGALERRHPVPPEALRAEAAVVLAGAVDLHRSTAQRVEFYDRPERILEGVRLLRQGRAERLVISGGDPFRVGQAEADLLAVVARGMGVPEEVMILERGSRTTRENAQYTARILRARGIDSFFLVTSAFHMPRALACFRREGLAPIPYPVDFRAVPAVSSPLDYLPRAGALQGTTLALHEWFGYVAYRLFGYL